MADALSPADGEKQTVRRGESPVHLTRITRAVFFSPGRLPGQPSSFVSGGVTSAGSVNEQQQKTEKKLHFHGLLLHHGRNSHFTVSIISLGFSWFYDHFYYFINLL